MSEVPLQAPPFSLSISLSLSPFLSLSLALWRSLSFSLSLALSLPMSLALGAAPPRHTVGFADRSIHVRGIHSRAWYEDVSFKGV